MCVPVCVDRNMCSVYEAVISIISPNRIIVVGHQLNRADAIRSSLVKFMLGGVAMFMSEVKSHQAVVMGRIL